MIDHLLVRSLSARIRFSTLRRSRESSKVSQHSSLRICTTPLEATVYQQLSNQIPCTTFRVVVQATPSASGCTTHNTRVYYIHALTACFKFYLMAVAHYFLIVIR